MKKSVTAIVAARFVTFYSPGKVIPLETKRQVEEWDIPAEIVRSAHLWKTSGIRPFGFRFSYCLVRKDESTEEVVDLKTLAKSPMYWLEGEVLTFEQAEERFGDHAGYKIMRQHLQPTGRNKIIVIPTGMSRHDVYFGEYEEKDVLLKPTLGGE